MYGILKLKQEYYHLKEYLYKKCYTPINNIMPMVNYCKITF